MRFGVCTSWENVEIIKKLGYDYIELSLSTLSKMSEKEYNNCREKLKSVNMKAETFNGFFSDQLIVGNAVDYNKIRSYAKSSLERAATLGGKIAVFGSGRARRTPSYLTKNECENQIVNLLHILSDEAANVGMAIAIEPLNSTETDIINTVQEGIDITKKINSPNVGCLADLFHIYKSGETFDAIRNAGNLLYHVHIARMNDDRGMPTECDKHDLEALSKALSVCGYNNRISLEGKMDNLEYDLTEARKMLHVFESIKQVN